MLSPYEFGQLGIVMFFILSFKILSESGLAGALVRKENVCEDDYGTVFISNLILSIFLYVLIFFASSHIALYYDDPILELILQVSGLILIFDSFRIVQNARLVREMNFKKQSVLILISVIISTIIGVVMAYYNMGVWALVAIQISLSVTQAFLFWFFVDRIPRYRFNMKSFKGLYSYGINTTLSSVLDVSFDNLYQVVISRFFSIHQVGFFYQAKKLQEVPFNVLKFTIIGVVFSGLSKIQNQKIIFIKSYNRILSVFTVLVGAVTLVLYLYSAEFINILYGEKWIQATFFMKILVLISFFYMQEVFNRILFKIYNETHKILYLELLKKFIQVITIVLGLYYESLQLLMYGFLFTSIISSIINKYYSDKILEINTIRSLSSFLGVGVILVGIIISYSMFVNHFSIRNYNTFLLLPIVLICYFFLVKVFGLFSLKDDLVLLKSIIKNTN